MKIKDIVNRDVFQISNCASEPIHIPGSIQPYGALLAIDEETGLIKFCSANVSEFLEADPTQLLNQPVAALFSSSWETLHPFLQDTQTSQESFILNYNSKFFELTHYRTGSILVIELERYEEQNKNQQQLFQQTVSFVSRIEEAKSLQTLCQNVADETRRLTWYDRVMIYRFDKTWSGEVYAESRVDDLDPFLGLHYPHTDIPQQARDLYTRKLVRLISDVDYQPVPLLTLDESTANELDLSDSQLRSVSPIHIQYLKNMQVGATLTISLLQDGKLWGLIACHHRKPKLLSYSQRQTALLQGHFLSSQIRVRQVAEEYEVNLVVEAHLQQLLNKLEVDEDFSQKFEQFTSLMAVANATGVVILYKGELFEKGFVPTHQKTMALIRWLAGNVRSQFSTSMLQSRYPAGEAICKQAAGIIYQSLGKPAESCIIWFGEEVQRTVNWAGNPADAVQKSQLNNLLQPRSSFAIWKENVRYQSREWRVSEVNAASRFATSLQNYLHLMHVTEEDTRLRMVNEKLARANEELSNINWITSHDLKEPLRKIQLFASRIISTEAADLSEAILHSIQRIQTSASRMHLLVEDILTYSVTSDKNAKFLPTDLNAILSDVKEILQEEMADKKAVLEVNILPVVNGIPHQMRQLFSHLLSNALKFSEPGKPSLIRVSSKQVTSVEVPQSLLRPSDYHLITVADNGIGFDPTYSDRLFNIFYRLHSTDSYKGTGIGLAICKKIMENHNGNITADSKAGEGSVFSIYLPM